MSAFGKRKEGETNNLNHHSCELLAFFLRPPDLKLHANLVSDVASFLLILLPLALRLPASGQASTRTAVPHYLCTRANMFASSLIATSCGIADSRKCFRFLQSA